MPSTITIARRTAASKPKRAKFTWLDAIRADPRAQSYPHVGRRFLSDLALELTKFPSFGEEGSVYAGRDNLATRLRVTARQISRGLAALRDLGYLDLRRRGGAKTNLLVPMLNGKRLFDGKMSGPDHKVQGEWTSRSTLSGPPGPPSLLSLESLSIESFPPNPLPSSVAAPRAAEDGLTEVGRQALANEMKFAYENSEPFRAWRRFRGQDGMPPIDVRIVNGTRRRGSWFPSLYPRRR
jgi:hypothetical protein